MSEETHAYVGFKSCGCCVAAAVDAPQFAKDNAKFVAWLLKQGLRIERVTVEEVRKILKVCDCKRAVPELTQQEMPL